MSEKSEKEGLEIPSITRINIEGNAAIADHEGVECLDGSIELKNAAVVEVTEEAVAIEKPFLLSNENHIQKIKDECHTVRIDFGEDATCGDGSHKQVEKPSVSKQCFVRVPNVTLPCPDGVVIDVLSYLPKGVDASKATWDYVYGESTFQEDKLKVFPTDPGEQEIGLTYLLGGRRCTTIFKLLVNQDPKKLWVRNDPPSGSPFMKELYVSRSYRDEKARFLAASRRGRSHEQAGTFRDDDFGFWSNHNESVYLLVVADGAGSAKYSREGSRRVVKSVIDYLKLRLTSGIWDETSLVESKDGKVAQLLVSAANNALVQLDSFCKAENLKMNATEKYSLKDFNTTLLVSAIHVAEDGTRKIVSFSIGDGAIAWVEPEKSELLCAPDGGEYSGQTRFLTTTQVWAKAASDWAAFRGERVFSKTIGPENADFGFLVLMTDGVSDPFFETDVKLRDSKMWDEFVLSEADVDDGEKSLRNVMLELDDKNAESKLLNWLGFWSRGNHDDRTLALLSSTNLKGKYILN